MRSADQAMYAAKVAGKNQVRRFAEAVLAGPTH
jgi:PleD family two-component response regulator